MGDIISDTPTGGNTLRSRNDPFIIPCLFTLITVFIFSQACDWFMNEEKDKAQAVVLEIRSDPTFFDRDTSDGLIGFDADGVHLYDINENIGTLTLYGATWSGYDPGTQYLLITALEECVYGEGFSGTAQVLSYHESLSVKLPRWSGPFLLPDSLHFISVEDDDAITLAYKDSTFLLTPHSSWIWLDSMYVQHETGIELFLVDSVTFINRGELAIIIGE